MSITDAKHKIDTEPDFVNIKRFGYSLEKVAERYPDGCPDHVISQALGIHEYDVERAYQKVVDRLRGLMGVRE